MQCLTLLPAAAPSMDTPSEARRRRLRKGAHSCWECKRRKIRCIFERLTDAYICNGCQRRGTRCVSQAFPEEVARDAVVRNRRDRSMDGRRTATPRADACRAEYGIPAPVSVISQPARSLAFYNSSEKHLLPARGKYAELSRLLHASLPSREDTKRICTASRHPSVLTHEIITMPYTALEQNGLATPATLLEILKPNKHPVLIAGYMLLLATFVQYVHPELHGEIKGFSESPQAIMKRLVDLAVSLVMTNDELLGSIEGLECIMIECVYQANMGNLRRTWISCRRGLSIAQLMGLDRRGNQAQYKVLDSKTKYHAHHMWLRIVFLDRYLCLMLGVSQGCLDRRIASDAMLADDAPMGRLVLRFLRCFSR